MTKKEVIDTLRLFFPGSFSEESPFINSEDGHLILSRLLEMADSPIHVTHFNQLLHLNHEAGASNGFFEYYFCSAPQCHPYPVDKIIDISPNIDEKGISSLKQMEWGLRRFYIDALLFWGDIRSAYRHLRTKSYSEIEEYFTAKRFDSKQMRKRGAILPLKDIPENDRYLISEVACKAYSSEDIGGPVMMERALLDVYRICGNDKIKIEDLFNRPPRDIEACMNMLLPMAEEIIDERIESEEDIPRLVKPLVERFNRARQSALDNTRLYLSIVNELDVYVATSMRSKSQFLQMAADCNFIFSQEGLNRFNIRYFDPTKSAADSHEDKGLLECLMVKCAKALLYFAGEEDTFGKDAEVAMAMSLGKPVIILCPNSNKGKERMRIFKEIHPLGRLIHFDTGIAVGAMVTQSRDEASILLDRILNNSMEYDFENHGDGYFRLRERLTDSVVRLQTNNQMLRESFWNYYHQTP
jgi:hypothetical protein